jgi:hypothetical protein
MLSLLPNDMEFGNKQQRGSFLQERFKTAHKMRLNHGL